MMIQTAFSKQPLRAAVAEIKAAHSGPSPKVVLFFASAGYDAAEISAAMQDAFPDSIVAGCSTAGELVTGHMLQGAITAMFLDAATVEDVAAVVVNDLGPGGGVKAAFKDLEAHFGARSADWDLNRYVGLVLVDGLSGAEERLMDKLGDITDVFFVGGSAGDDLRFQSTHVYLNGKSYNNSAVLLVLRLSRGFEILKTQSFVSTGKTLVATAVNESRREVLEFNHKPALEAYAEAVGVDVSEATGRFFRNPVGLMVDGEPYVRSPQRADGDGIVFYCQIKEGMELELLDATDIVADTRRVLDARKAALGDVRGVIDFHCILRALQLRQENRCGEYAAVFGDTPTVGFSTYGEAFLGHVNQTSTMLLLR